MAFAVADRVKETSTTTGTGTLNLAGAEPGYQTFVAGIGNGNTTYYAIVNRATSEFEVGIGTVTDAATDTLSRDTIISSSNSDLAVNFSAGTKDVICTLPSEKSYVLNDAGNTTISSNLSVTAISGSGAGLTTLNASNLASGTLPDARFPATLPASSGANLTNLNASNVSSGTLDNARLSAIPNSALENSAITLNGTGVSLGGSLNLGDIEGVTAGNGLTGGGTTGTVTLNVGAGNLIDVTADAIDVDLSELTTSTSDADGDFFVVVDSVNAQKKLTKGNINLSGFNNDANFSTTTGTVTSVSGGNGLTGTVTTSGSLAVGAGTLIDVTADAVNVDLSELATSTSDADGDFFCVVDSVNAQKKLTKGNINISGFNNDAGYTTNVGDITGVTAGSGLTGGGASGSVTLNVGAGTGIDVAADSISVDVSDFMSNGSNNRVLTATGTDAMNAEANMTFDGSTLAVTGAITATGDITAFFTSDETLKTNIENIQNPMDKVMELNGVYYDWTQEAKDKHSHLGDAKEIGVIAQQVEKVLPEMVGTRDDGTKAVRYERMCALLIECVKDLQNQVNELKKDN